MSSFKIVKIYHLFGIASVLHKVLNNDWPSYIEDSVLLLNHGGSVLCGIIFFTFTTVLSKAVAWLLTFEFTNVIPI